jgi:hypothetical protein
MAVDDLYRITSGHPPHGNDLPRTGKTLARPR